MRSLLALAVVPFFFAFIGGCSEQPMEDGSEGSAQAVVAGENDLLTKCSALEEVELESLVIGDSSTLVQQSYIVDSYTNESGVTVPRSKWTSASAPSVIYSLRFYRDKQGASKFQLSIGTWGGMQSSIDGPKKLTASGSVAFAYDGTTSDGTLTLHGRHELMDRVFGTAVPKIHFSNLDCTNGSDVSLTLPLVSLEKKDDATVEIRDMEANVNRKVSPKVIWKKKADQVTLQFHAAEGC